MVKICLDAGHGGSDSGAVGNGRLEKDYTLKITLGIGNKLMSEYDNVQVVYTRTSDVYVSLEERANISNRNKCDYFASSHVNSGGGYGVETFAHNNSTKGKQFANVVQNEMVNRGLVTRNRGVKTANFAVLRLTNCPAILIENHFIDNANDMTFLDENLDKIISAQTESIANYIGATRKNKVTLTELPLDFSEHFYLLTYPDVADAVKRGDCESGRSHYMSNGASEGREYKPKLPSDFTEVGYLINNKDVADAVNRGDYRSGSAHWYQYGFSESRKYTLDKTNDVDLDKLKNSIIESIENIFKNQN